MKQSTKRISPRVPPVTACPSETDIAGRRHVAGWPQRPHVPKLHWLLPFQTIDLLH